MDQGSKTSSDKALVLYDGYCVLCSSTVRFLQRRDRKNNLHYAPLTSEEGMRLLDRFNLQDEDTVVLVKGNQAWDRSSAALQICALLPFPWKVLQVFWIVPRPWRDRVYMWVARNRASWWGRHDQCFLPEDGRSGID